ncbi:hypothetical protein [Methylobacterium sp. Leaf102]|uniref:hypothetical protein n=1 Tax=Methylobacterium sp. Leaf102 TaxID=1736253 RepID=UPI000A744B5D|nr:hypothetical protein [Methylobacterium sp. Leaf102]
MTSPPRLSRSERLRLIIPGVFILLVILTLAGFSFWQTWRSIEAYYLAKNGTEIEATVISASSYRITLSGLVKFRIYDKNIYRECITKTDFGGESNYLKFKPGAVIKVIPRFGCDEPIIITSMRFPIIKIIPSIFCIAFIFLLAKNIRQASR